MEVDSNTLLEWLRGSELRDLQEMALEQFCGILLMAESIDTCLRLIPPKKFVPALCEIFLDQAAPDNLLEITARAITYYLEMDIGLVAHYIVHEVDAIRAISNKLVISSDGANKDLVEQCIKVLEYICINSSKVVLKAGGINSILAFIKNHGDIVHRNTLHSAISTISAACRTIDPIDFETSICLEDFSALLRHENERVANGALNGFNSVAYKFEQSRRDPTLLAKHGLLKALLDRLITITDSYATGLQDTGSDGTEPNSKTITTIFKLLSILCRGSSSITEELLQTNFLEVIEQVMTLNKTSVLDSIKFVNILLALLCENKRKLNKNNTNSPIYLASLEELHSNIIEYIVMQDYDAFSHCLETNSIELDYMDSFGQTLLNWASAIGTNEMVEYLCKNGADVKKGERGSSLHYAASAGKPYNIKSLLKYGATPDFKDENGKTALDKAKEGNTNDHIKAVTLLESAYLWMSTPTEQTNCKAETDSKKEDNAKMAPVYLQRLLPVFCTAFQSTTFDVIGDATLNSIEYMVHYIKPCTLKDLCASRVNSQNFATHLAETMSGVLNDKCENRVLMALKIIRNLLKKCEEIFIIAFARLGIFFQVQNLGGPELEKEISGVRPSEVLEDATEILPETAYYWHHWCICLGSNGFYVWYDSATLEFCNNSNGWFRSYINGKLHTMYSCGRIESGSSQNSLSFLTKFDVTCRTVKNALKSTPILSKPGSTLLVINNWSITSPNESELHIQNLENPQQKTTLPAKTHGFLHESDNGSKFSFTCKKYMGPKISSGWVRKYGVSELASTKEIIKGKIERLAYYIYEKYFKTSHIQKGPAMIKLENIVMQINRDYEKQASEENLKNSLNELCEILVDSEAINLYEFENSGLVKVLLLLFEQKKCMELVSRCFEEKSTNGKNIFAFLVQKLIAALENTDKLPVDLYHDRNQLVGLCVLKNSFRLVLKRIAGEDQLIDRSENSFYVEPLCTVKELEEFLLKVVIKKSSSKSSGALKKENSNVLNSVVSSVSDAAPVSEVVSGSDLVLESAVESREVVDLDTPASGSNTLSEAVVGSVEVMNVDIPITESIIVPELESDAVLESPVASREFVNLDTPAWESSVILDSAIASGSREVMDLDIPATESVTVLQSAVATVSDAVPEFAVESNPESKVPLVSNTVTKSEVLSREIVDLDPPASGSSAILESPSVSGLGEVMDLDLSAMKSIIVPESSVSTASDSVAEVTLGSNPEPNIVPESEVLSREVVDLDPPTSSSSAILESEEVRDLDIIVTESVIVSELDVASGSSSVSECAVSSSASGGADMTQHPKTILERILTTVTDGEASVASESGATFRERAESSGDSSDSSDEDTKNQENTWGGRFHLKATYPDLVPRFDLRPEHYVNPTSDLEILPPGVEEFTITSKNDAKFRPKLKLIVKNNFNPEEIHLTDGNCTIFKAIRELMRGSRFDLDGELGQIWHYHYRILYRELNDDDLSPKPSPPVPNSNIDDVLQLLRHLFVISTSKRVNSTVALSPDKFFSKKINDKLLLQMKDTLMMSSLTIPDWCQEFIRSYSFLFPFETRQLYFQITSFGATRTVMWFQAQEDLVNERLRTGTAHGRYLRNEPIGRLKIDRIRVPRGDNFLEWAMQALKMHCNRKAKLEIQFNDEEGTGLGPTLEFYALAAAELQRRNLAMWICDDDHLLNAEEKVNVSDGTKAPGYYVRKESGLFPAPLPQDSELCNKAEKYFWVLGVLLAKVLQDNRLVDIPLSKSFLKLMCHKNTVTSANEHNPWYHGILGLHDLHDIDPVRAEFLKKIRKLVKQKTAIMQDTSLCSDSKTSQIQNLKVNYASGPISLQDLALNFTYTPSSKTFGISAMELVPNGADIEVTIENIDEYCDLTFSFALDKGIARQLEAFHQGFSEVFPMEKLAPFSPNELRIIMCGDQNPQWTKEDLINYTEPKLGYTKESPGFLKFVNVLLDISPEEKKAFVQFITGCSSLPPGGLANLHPRLTVVKKVDSGEGSYPSVNTCVHYLKLPDYSTEEILKERLLIALKETGFHFN